LDKYNRFFLFFSILKKWWIFILFLYLIFLLTDSIINFNLEDFTFFLNYSY